MMDLERVAVVLTAEKTASTRAWNGPRERNQTLVLMPRGGASLVQIDAFSRAFLVLVFKLTVFFSGLRNFCNPRNSATLQLYEV